MADMASWCRARVRGQVKPEGRVQDKTSRIVLQKNYTYYNDLYSLLPVQYNISVIVSIQKYFPCLL